MKYINVHPTYTPFTRSRSASFADRRSISVEVDFVEETAKNYRKHFYQYQDVDVILSTATIDNN